MIERHLSNAPGEWFIDTRCINCSASHTVAPGLIIERDGQCVFARQPETAEDLKRAWRARLLCPTASVRTEHHTDVPEGIFPEEMTNAIYRLGYNAAASYGAHSFLIRGASTNKMIDSPRWTKAVVELLEKWGGVADICLTHEDDVADSERYAKHFGAAVWIHEADRAAAPYADRILRGDGATSIDSKILAIPVPGHSRGSVVYLYDQNYLFTGDSLAWSFERSDLTAFHGYCWSWPEQIASLRHILDYEFAWVFAGHGGSFQLPAGEMKARLIALVDRMERSPSEL
jgi:glyoxylase-like metal-dependent hydrolase (beta-lactamase superfamily II)